MRVLRTYILKYDSFAVVRLLMLVVFGEVITKTLPIGITIIISC